MSETTTTMAMGGTAMAAPKQIQDRPSYVSGIDGPPDTWPEVARELTMLRGQVDGVRARLVESHEALINLASKLRPVITSTPKTGAVVGSGIRAETTPAVSTAIGYDLRAIGDEVDSLQMQAERLTTIIGEITRDVLL